MLHQASARVGVATANRYPKISLSAMLGSLPPSPVILYGFTSSPDRWFNRYLTRRVECQAARSRGGIRPAGAAYKEVVLQGFREVADALRALEADAMKLRERSEPASHARTAYEITRKRYEAGAVSQLTVLDAHQQYQHAAMDQAQARADRYANTAALFQALGGGWWSKEDRPQDEPMRRTKPDDTKPE